MRNIRNFIRKVTTATSFVAIAGVAVGATDLEDKNTVPNPQCRDQLKFSKEAFRRLQDDGQDLNSQHIAYEKAADAVKRYMIINGVPGVSVGVSVNGSEVWRTGFGFADVETGAKCTGDSVMRIASISKAITSAVVGKLIESGQLDIDKSIYEYLNNEFPRKTFNKESVEITMRQLLSHLGGIRHYSQTDCEGFVKVVTFLLNVGERVWAPYLERPKESAADGGASKKAKTDGTEKEFLSNKKYASVVEALTLFKDDNLVARPGTKFYYTTHGFTLASAVLEKVSGKTFPALLKELFVELGMHNTSIDLKADIVPNRAKYYRRNHSTHRLENVPEVDNSCKWSGGGIISNVADLLTFANALLYCYYVNQGDSPNSFLRRSTVEKLWSGQIEVPWNAEKSRKSLYGLGWMIVEPNTIVGGVAPHKLSGYWFHTGAAVGASSVLLIKPIASALINGTPQGVTVAILANCQDAGNGIVNLAREVAEIFESGLQDGR